MTQRNSQVLVALGCNLPFKNKGLTEVLQEALARLAESGLTLAACSRFFGTPAYPAGSGPDYVNAAALLDTTLPPAGVLAALHRVEADYGRERVQRWAGRTLDLDLLAQGDLVVPDLPGWQRWHDLATDMQSKVAPDQLILPHPRLQDRAFVLVPLLDIAPDWRHPVLQKTVRQMCSALPQHDIASVRPL